MDRLIVIVFICVSLLSVSGQGTNKSQPKIKDAEKVATNYKSQLENAIAKSKKAKKLRVDIEGEIQNKKISSKFEYVAPDRFSFVDKVSDKIVKEAIEISKQRFQKKGEQWIKTREDYFPIRDQYNLFFPVFTSKPDDAIKIKNVEVKLLDKETINEKAYQKYSYSIFYDELDNVDSGIAWINEGNGLLEKLETETIGLFGRAKSSWIYNYDDLIIIDAPEKFIVKDWVD